MACHCKTLFEGQKYDWMTVKQKSIINKGAKYYTMEIRVAPFTFLISLVFSLIQIIIMSARMVFKNKWEYLSIQKLKSGNARTITLIIFITNLLLFTVYNAVGVVIAYTNGYIIYRSDKLSNFERVLQIIEIVFESVTKSLIFFSLILFLPVFSIINSYYGTVRIRTLEFQFIIIYSIIRIIFYPTLYLFFYKYPMLGLYFIEIINLSETFLLFCFYCAVYNRLKSVIGKSQTFNLRRTSVLEHLFKKFRLIAIIFFVQLAIEILYKLCIICLTIVEAKMVNLIFLDLSLFLRLVSFSLQFYCLLCLALPEEKDAPDSIFWSPGLYFNDDFMFFNPYYKESSESIKIPEQRCQYIVQPNSSFNQESNEWEDIKV